VANGAGEDGAGSAGEGGPGGGGGGGGTGLVVGDADEAAFGAGPPVELSVQPANHRSGNRNAT